jgi:hypothetical protein
MTRLFVQTTRLMLNAYFPSRSLECWWRKDQCEKPQVKALATESLLGFLRLKHHTHAALPLWLRDSEPGVALPGREMA